MTLLELLEKINVTKAEDIKLFFVTRAIKEGLTRNSRTRDKYLLAHRKSSVAGAAHPISQIS